MKLPRRHSVMRFAMRCEVTRWAAPSARTFTHGSSAEPQEWFNKDFGGGNIQSCPTFDGKLAP